MISVQDQWLLRHRITLSAANRNYTLRGMYNYATGFNAKGWAIAASVAYRWANRGYVEGTFYNSLSYYFGVQKKWNNGHSLALSTGVTLQNVLHKVQVQMKSIGSPIITNTIPIGDTKMGTSVIAEW